MNIKNQNNVKLKAKFVVDNIEQLLTHYSISRNAERLVQVMKRDGIKCHCCEQDNIFYRINDCNVLEAHILRDGATNSVRMTVDHDDLRSLGGVNSADNYHALCEKCNTLREDRFAGYAEFKAWYDKSRSTGKSMNKPARCNYSVIDFKKAISEPKYHVVFTNGIPKIMKDQIMDHVVTKGKDFRLLYQAKAIRRVPVKDMNKFFAELVHAMVSKKLGYKIENDATSYNVIDTTKMKDMKPKDYLDMINTRLKSHVGVVLKSERAKQVQVVHTAAKVQTIQKDNFWTRLTKAFNVLFS